jgi:hypothetical protein
MSNWCLGCHREIHDGDYCSMCRVQLGVDSLGRPYQLERRDPNFDIERPYKPEPERVDPQPESTEPDDPSIPF